jgi:hypothetical protein
MITTTFHPYYKIRLNEYLKWRLTYEGGHVFIHQYLKKFDAREDDKDFEDRRAMAYCPAFAKEGIIEIKNGIYQRMSEISRKSGSQSYRDAIEGLNGGVDLEGSSMNTFIAQKVLSELLTMGLTGVYVDMPVFNPQSTLAAFQKVPRPYLYPYRAEDIANWNWVVSNNELYFTHLLLRERQFIYDVSSGLPTGEKEVYRYLKLQEDGVLVQFWEQYTEPSGRLQERMISETLLQIPSIPFVLFDIGNSLLRDVADYQVGLLNLASSDLNYSLKANFPFYTEPYDSKTEALYQNKGPITIVGDDKTAVEQANRSNTGTQELSVGITRGRRYPLGGDRPGFINPSPEPLMASMKKQEQMREEIRALLNLGLSNVAPSRASAESKRVDQVGLESGLSAIGLELETGEAIISKYWENYLKSTSTATIVYPTTYSLKTDEQRMNEAEQQRKLKIAVPSKTFQKLMAMKIADTLFEGKVPSDELEIVHKEINSANYITSDPAEIKIDMDLGLVTAETASNARGYDGSKEVPLAQQEYAKRLAVIATSQSQGIGAARGIPAGPQDQSANTEKTASQKADFQGNPADPQTRGPNAPIH